MMAEENNKNDTVGLFLRAMVDREPGKRKVKPSKSALIDLAELDLGESSDDSDFNVDEAKLKEDDDISINSDPDAYDDDDDDDDDVSEEDSEEEIEQDDGMQSKSGHSEFTVVELLQKAKQKQLPPDAKTSMKMKILVCAICLGDYSDDANEIVICDGCHVSVHEGCYGISDTISVSSTISSSSTEPWFCDSCKSGAMNPTCELCPNLGHTIFKETEMGRWVHLVCALYIPGIAFSEVDKLSFPTLFEMPYSRFGAKTCSLCEDERFSKTGVCIGCDAGMCRSYFHVTCAQREGLLSEVNHGEADQADPYYAHCKLHSDKELIRRRKRNWLALQLRMKQGELEKQSFSQESQDRLQRKLMKYKEKYMFIKSIRPTPWFPTQKMPRSLTTCASLFRSLVHKTKLMGLDTESPIDATSLGDIRKKWHIPPAFNVEFISYYIDRNSRLQEMKSRLDFLLKENEGLVQQEASLRERYNLLDKETKEYTEDNESLLNKSLELHDLLKGLAGRPLRLPAILAAMQPPFVGVDTSPTGRVGSAGKGKKVLTKAAAKMMSDSPLSSNGMPHSNSYKPSNKITTATTQPGSDGSTSILNLHKCSVCLLMRDQHLMILCDTCMNYYHLACLDPPLSRMPKKTKQMGWQCSDCCKSSDSDKAPEIDTAAPRRLRRIIKEPAKFSPSVSTDQKTVHERSIQLAGPLASGNVKSEAISCAQNQTPEKEKSKTKSDPKGASIKGRRLSENKETKRGRKKKFKKKITTTPTKGISVTNKKSYKNTSILKECKLEVYPLPKIDKSSVKQKTPTAKEEPEKSATPGTPGRPRIRRTTQDSFSDSSPSSPARKKIALDLKDEQKIKGGEGSKVSCKNELKDFDLSTSKDAVRTSDDKVKETKVLERKSSIDVDSRNNCNRTVLEKEAVVKISDVVLYPKENGLKTENKDSMSLEPSAKKIKKEEPDKNPLVSAAKEKNFPESSYGFSIKKSSDDIAKPSQISKFKNSEATSSAFIPKDESKSLNQEIQTKVDKIKEEKSSEYSSSNNLKDIRKGNLLLSSDCKSLARLTSSSSSTSSRTSSPSTCLQAVTTSTASLSKQGNQLDVSAESLPSVSSLSSPRSESLHSTEDDPLSPRKEKRHRDGSKKKKKDKDKDRESDSGRKRKKHHHRDRHNLAEITSEMVSPFRIKIKSLPPRPTDKESMDASYTQLLNATPSISLAPHTTSTTTAPPGYPPLPPGYTLTQPMAVTTSITSYSGAPSPLTSSSSGSSSSNKLSTLPSVTVVTSGASTVSSLGPTKTQVGRRKSDPSGEQFSKCDVCGEMGGVTNTVTCDECLKAYHFNCLEPPLKKSPKRRGYSWFCEDCDNAAMSHPDPK